MTNEQPTPAWDTLTPEVQGYVLFVLEERLVQLEQTVAKEEAAGVLRNEALKSAFTKMGVLEGGPAFGAIIAEASAAALNDLEPVEAVLAMAIRSAIDKLSPPEVEEPSP